jgi:hypothetical protein
LGYNLYRVLFLAPFRLLFHQTANLTNSGIHAASIPDNPCCLAVNSIWNNTSRYELPIFFGIKCRGTASVWELMNLWRDDNVRARDLRDGKQAILALLNLVPQ